MLVYADLKLKICILRGFVELPYILGDTASIMLDLANTELTKLCNLISIESIVVALLQANLSYRNEDASRDANFNLEGVYVLVRELQVP